MADPIREELALDLDPALAAVDRLDDALTSVATNFRASLSDAIIQGLSEPVQAPPLDTATLSEGIAAAIETATATPAVITADSASVAAAVEAGILDAADTPVTFDQVDTAAIEAGISTAIDAASDTPAQITADTTGVTDDVAAAITDGSGAPVVIDDVDTDAVTEAIAAAVDDTPPIPFAADVTAAEDAIDTLAGTLADAIDAGLAEPIAAPPLDTSALTDGIAAAIETASDTPAQITADSAGVSEAVAAGIADGAAAPVVLDQVDTDAVTAGIADAIDAASGTPATITADTAGVSEDVAAAITDGADAPVVISEVDTEAITVGIADAVGDIPPIEFEADVSAAEETIATLADTLADAIDAGLAEPIAAPPLDTSSLTDGIAAAIGSASDTPAEITADTAGVSDDVAAAIIEGAAAPVVLDEVDTSAVTAGIAQAVADVPPIDVDADVTAAQEAIAALENTTVQVNVETDTGGAAATQDELQTELGQTAQQADVASSGLDRLGVAATATGSASALAQGKLSGLSSAQQLLGGTAGQAAAGFGAVIAAGAAFANQAIEADAATQRFEQTLGLLADDVNRIDVGDLNTDLSDLAVLLGSDDDALRNVISSIVQLGESSGLSTGILADQAEAITALAARAVALNPALGDVAQVADAMAGALARGGRFAAEFNVSLTPTEIRARAAENAIKGVGNGADVASLSLAGSQLAIEKYGDTLDREITQGAQNPITALARLRQTFSEATEEIGKPLQAPLFAVLEQSIPVGVQLAQIIGTLAQVGLPALEAFLEALGLVLGALLPVIGLLELIPEPVVAAAGAFVLLSAALRVVVGLLPAFAAATGTLSALVPIVAVIGAIAGTLLSLGDSVETVTPALPGLAEELTKVRQAADGTSTGIVNLTDNVRDLLFAGQLGEFGDRLLSDNVLGRLQRVGFSISELTQAFAEGEDGSVAWRRALIDAGLVAVDAPLTPDRIDALTEAWVQNGGAIGDVAVAQGFLNRTDTATLTGKTALIDAFGEQNLAQQESSRSALQELREQSKLTDGQERQLRVLEDSGDAFANYTGLLETVTEENAQLGGAIDESTASLAGFQGGMAELLNLTGVLTSGIRDSNDAWVALALSIANGTTATNDYATAATLLGVSREQVAAFGDAVNASINAFVDSAVARLPEASAAFEDLSGDAAFTADQIAFQFARVIKDSFTVAAVIAELERRDLPNLAAAVAEGGPEAAAAIAAILESTPDRLEGLETWASNARSAIKAAETVIEEVAPDLVTRTGILGDDLEAEFHVDFASALSDDLASALEIFEQFDVPDTVGEAGVKIGEEFAEGVARGVGDSLGITDRAGRDLVGATETGARDEADARSPSRLFARLGEDLRDGLNEGLLADVTSGKALIDQIAAQVAAGQVSVSPSIVPVAPQVIAATAPATVAAADVGTGDRIGVQVQGPLIGAINETVEPFHVAAEIGWRFGP